MIEMKIAQREFPSFENEGKDWDLAKQKATFSHREACEFIFYVGTCRNSHYVTMVKYKENGFSAEMIRACKEAYAAGFNYLCLYA